MPAPMTTARAFAGTERAAPECSSTDVTSVSGMVGSPDISQSQKAGVGTGSSPSSIRRRATKSRSAERTPSSIEGCS